MLGAEIKKRIFVVLFLVICGSAFVYAQSEETSSAVKIPPPLENGVVPQYQEPQKLEKASIQVLTAQGQTHNFQVELARTSNEHRVGMMFRNIVPENTGMLFLFEKEAERHFWMRNTWVSLDLIFIRNDGVIRHIHKNAQPRSLEQLGSNGLASAVLEIGGGEAQRLGLNVGDRVLYEAFQKDKP